MNHDSAGAIFSTFSRDARPCADATMDVEEPPAASPLPRARALYQRIQQLDALRERLASPRSADGSSAIGNLPQGLCDDDRSLIDGVDPAQALVRIQDRRRGTRRIHPHFR